MEENISLTEGILVSLVTIVYNGEKHLEQTIQSVLSQSYKHIEYIIVDGGSTDGTLEIIKKYENQLAIWISEPDKGISDAFNKGIELAKGKLVGIINADDWLEPDALSWIVQSYKPGSVLHGNLQYWNQDGSKGMLVLPNASLLPQEMTVNHPTVFIEREMYAKYGMYDLTYRQSMDYHLLLRLFKYGIPFIHINKTIANMRLGGTSGNWINSYKETKRAKEEVLGKSVKHTYVYYWQIARRTVSERLADSPLAIVNKVYRKYFSPMKKV